MSHEPSTQRPFFHATPKQGTRSDTTTSTVSSTAAPGPASGQSQRLRHLRVLFLASRDIRHPANTGGDIGLWERAVYLAGEGHEVKMMASTFPGAPPREIIDGVTVVRMGGLLSLWWRTFLYYMTE